MRAQLAGREIGLTDPGQGDEVEHADHREGPGAGHGRIRTLVAAELGQPFGDATGRSVGEP